MKNSVRIVMAFIGLASLAAAQIVIENPAQPAAKNAGRIITLKEELRIEDTGKDFYLKQAWKIRVSPRGDIFVQDGQDQALLFDPQGRFVRNVLKKGQGPEEIANLIDIWISPDLLFLYGTDGKILASDFSGRVIRELPSKITGWMKFISANRDRVLLYKENRPDPSKGVGRINVPIDIVEVSMADGSHQSIGAFPHQIYFELLPGGGSSITGWNRLHAISVDPGMILVNAAPEYLVEVHSREKKEVIRRFKRPYQRVKSSGKGGVSGGGNAPPPPEFEPDIWDLHFVDGKCWVQTSTVLKDKGILFDVYDLDGRYLDCFYIPTKNIPSGGKPYNMNMTFSGGFVYFADKNEDDLVVIRKCRLVGL